MFIIISLFITWKEIKIHVTNIFTLIAVHSGRVPKCKPSVTKGSLFFRIFQKKKMFKERQKKWMAFLIIEEEFFALQYVQRSEQWVKLWRIINFKCMGVYIYVNTHIFICIVFRIYAFLIIIVQKKESTTTAATAAAATEKKANAQRRRKKLIKMNSDDDDGDSASKQKQLSIKSVVFLGH